ncbi:MAG TPA: cysteine desulfurase family protein [Actinomycetota bacterium]|nr:cysteine desulfurase family protein [Actinomycetota bacterium]
MEHYLDHAATTPVLPEVTDLMVAILREDYGNPSSVHGAGRRAKELVEDARDRVARAIGARPDEIVFTGGGTEADNLALKGAAAKLRGNGEHVVVSAFEHHAVLDAAHWLEGQGFDVSIAPVTPEGRAESEVVAGLVGPRTILVSVMTVNNEIGTVQHIKAIADAVHGKNPHTVVHTDAVQALGNVPVDLHAWGVDLAAFAAHKLGGPKGVGALFVRSGVAVDAIVHGGGQERGMRSGTLNVAGIAGFGLAAEIAAKEVYEKSERLLAMRERLLTGLRESIPDLVVNGALEHRVAGNLNVSIPGTEGETLLLLLDQAGIACSSGSACASGALDPSHVLLSIGSSRQLARGSLRFSLGRASTDEDVEAVLDALPGIVQQARRAA